MNFKDIDTEKSRKAKIAWEKHMQNPDWCKIGDPNIDPWATAFLGKLPPGWFWNSDGEPEKRESVQQLIKKRKRKLLSAVEPGKR